MHPTTDGDFVVFHDWTVDCRTEGSGVTREQSLAALKALDIGYGYTADAGATFPFRGKGVGLMPTLAEVLAAFPDRRFLINIKSDDENEGQALAARIAALPAEQAALIMVYGGGGAIEAYRQALPLPPCSAPTAPSAASSATPSSAGPPTSPRIAAGPCSCCRRTSPLSSGASPTGSPPASRRTAACW